MGSSLGKRIVSMLILIPVAVAVVYFGGIPFILWVAAAAGLMMHEWVRMARRGNHVVRDYIIGAVYIFAATASFADLRLRSNGGLYLVMALVLCVWASDIGAYIAGKLLGGPKLCPKISPNKTWTGLAGAMIFPALAFMTILHVVPFCRGGYCVNPWLAIPSGLVFGLVGQAGDLMISMFKRRVGVKDTGSLIPGHGGILDRLDSLMLVTPVFFLAYVIWL